MMPFSSTGPPPPPPPPLSCGATLNTSPRSDDIKPTTAFISSALKLQPNEFIALGIRLEACAASGFTLAKPTGSFTHSIAHSLEECRLETPSRPGPVPGFVESEWHTLQLALKMAFPSGCAKAEKE